MKKFTLLEIKSSEIANPIITMGVFDGVHRGHQSLLQKVYEYATKNSYTPTIVTFASHPAAITKKMCPLTITSLSKRLSLVEKFNINTCILIEFDDRIASIPAEKFIEDYFVAVLDIKGIVIGENFRFGYQGKGNPQLLEKLGQKNGFFVDIQAPIKYNNDCISSSLVRKAILHGDCAAAQVMLGRPFSIRGKVIDGQKRGRELGFPTANLKLDHTLIPQDGVYMGYTVRQQKTYLSLISIGNNPTFAGEKKSIEVYIDKFSENIYGETMETFLLQKIRGQVEFTSIAKLVEQMNDDLRIAQDIFLEERKTQLLNQ